VATELRACYFRSSGSEYSSIRAAAWEAAVYDWINRVIAKRATTPQRSLP
jgi:hypothetical protein